MCFCIFFFITNICAYKHFIGLFGMLVNWRNGICSIYHCVTCFFHSALWFWNVATLIHVVLNHIFSLLIRAPLNAFITFYSSPCVRYSANFHIFLLLETRLWLIFFFYPSPCVKVAQLGRYLDMGLLGSGRVNWQLYWGWTVFQSGCTNLHLDSNVWVPMVGFLNNTLVMSNFKTFAKLVGVKWYSSVWICNSLFTSETEHAFICLLAICLLSFLNCPLGLFDSASIGLSLILSRSSLCILDTSSSSGCSPSGVFYCTQVQF